MRVPRRLAEPGTIGLIAPSGYISDPEILDAAIARLEKRGWRVVQGGNIRNKWKYFAGTDAKRVAELHAMAVHPEVDVVMSVRGGYGISRLLTQIDYAALAASGKHFVGFSDFTALSLALLSQAGYTSISGPMARVDFGHEDVDALMEQNFWPLFTEATHTTPRIDYAHPHGTQSVTGTAWGTNLSLVAHLAGTPYMPAIDDGILIVEDIGEEPYHIERCFMQLKLAGILDRQRAIILATFNGFDPESDVARRLTLEDVVETLRGIVSCPILAGYPFGHAPEKLSVPVGGRARVDIGPAGFQVTYSDYNG